MEIKTVFDGRFSEYGRVAEELDPAPLLEVLKGKPCPEHVLYVPSDPDLEGLPAAEVIRDRLFGGMPVQLGYTNGHNRKMNALEYHKASEYNVADEDVILFLARRQDLGPAFRMDTASVEAFRVPAGVMVELYATTLHYAPCQTGEQGYRCLVALPRGTNLPLPPVKRQDGEDRLLAAVNKWLIGHPEGGCEDGVYLGLTGPNPEV